MLRVDKFEKINNNISRVKKWERKTGKNNNFEIRVQFVCYFFETNPTK
jgi:hypothetical protein